MYHQQLSKSFLLIPLYLMLSNILQYVNCNGFKYSRSPLLSSVLVDHVNDFGTQSSKHIINTKSINIKDDSSNNDGANTSLNNAAVVAALNEPSGRGGEVLASKSFPLSSHEPTCEQLRAMWIFSKRQSRAAEITNEIPTYRDPFTYNVWEPYYPTARSLSPIRMVPQYSERLRSPVFGRIINREPLYPQHIGQRQRHLTENGSVRAYGAESKPLTDGMGTRRASSQYRYMGTNGLMQSGSSNQNSAAVQGSFQKLKELIWTERAKELTQQRRAEELAARAAVLKEIANGQNIQASYMHPQKSESILMDENRSPDREYIPYTNDDKFSLTSGKPNSQSILNKNNGEVKNPIFSSGRSIPSKGHGMHKSSIFSRNTASSFGQLPLSFPQERDYATNSGIPKVFPVRSSHFRERNRSLLNQNMGFDHFQREARYDHGVHSLDSDIKYMLLENIFNPHRKYFKLLNDGNNDLIINTREKDSNTNLFTNMLIPKTESFGNKNENHIKQPAYQKRAIDSNQELLMNINY